MMLEHLTITANPTVATSLLCHNPLHNPRGHFSFCRLVGKCVMHHLLGTSTKWRKESNSKVQLRSSLTFGLFFSSFIVKPRPCFFIESDPKQIWADLFQRFVLNTLSFCYIFIYFYLLIVLISLFICNVYSTF